MMNTDRDRLSRDKGSSAGLRRQDCMDILKEYGTPDHVIRHCEAVARVAVAVGEQLNRKGYCLDVRLAEAAALLHDMARTRPNHDQVAAAYLREKGHRAEADIIAAHMHYPGFNPLSRLDETDLVCLGDRVCKEDQYVGVEERMAYVLAKTKDDPVVTEIIRKKKVELLAFTEELAQVMGCTLDQLMER